MTAFTAGDFFQRTNVAKIEITIPEKGMETLRAYRWDAAGGDKVDRPQAMAQVIEGNNVFTNVAVQLKGRFGTFRPIDKLPSLTLNFDKFAKKQKFHGLTKISLNNSLQDPTCIHEKLARELFLAAGVPAPRADYALVSLNGRDLGLYVLTEGYGKQFLKGHFSRESGNLYDAGHLEDIDEPLERDSGDGPADHADLKKLEAAARLLDAPARFRALDEVLDVDRFVSMVALEVLLCHWDSYSMNRNNYRLYTDPSTGKCVFMPHGMDQLLGIDRPILDLAIVPPMTAMVTRALLTTPEGRKRYLDRIGVLFTNLFQPAKLCRRVREIDTRIAPHLQHPEKRWPLRSEQPRAFIKTSGSHARDVNDLCERITTRAAHLTKQFSQPRRDWELPPVPKFDTNGIAKLEHWKHRGGSQDGNDKALQLSQVDSSWRTRYVLPPGRYMLTGRAKVEAGRAVIRVSGTPTGPSTRASDWRQLNLPIDVADVVQEFEFVLELKDRSGPAFFDSLALKQRNGANTSPRP